MTSTTSLEIGVGFGTAALGNNCFETVMIALEAGFRKFDTAEADYWYDQKCVGEALESFLSPSIESDKCQREIHQEQDNQEQDDFNSDKTCTSVCQEEKIEISTKIPPWELTSVENIRNRAALSRDTLLGFCDYQTDQNVNQNPYPLDVYYIHAPACWKGWHPRCSDVGKTLALRDAWTGMEAVAGIDGNAKRIGLSNVRPDELLDIISFVNERKEAGEMHPPPRMPDVLQAYADPIEPSTELRRICSQYGIEFVSYSTLGTQHVMRTNGENPVLGHPDVNDLAEKYKRSTAEVVLSWALQRGMSVIPRSSNEAHIWQLSNLLTNDPFLLSEDLLIIDGLGLN